MRVERVGNDGNLRCGGEGGGAGVYIAWYFTKDHRRNDVIRFPRSFGQSASVLGLVFLGFWVLGRAMALKTKALQPTLKPKPTP